MCIFMLFLYLSDVAIPVVFCVLLWYFLLYMKKYGEIINFDNCSISFTIYDLDTFNCIY